MSQHRDDASIPRTTRQPRCEQQALQYIVQGALPCHIQTATSEHQEQKPNAGKDTALAEVLKRGDENLNLLGCDTTLLSGSQQFKESCSLLHEGSMEITDYP